MLRLAAELIEGGDCAAPRRCWPRSRPAIAWEWRVGWYRGMADLPRGGPATARTSFAAVYRSVPGELAPKLALGLACEHAGELAEAAAGTRSWPAPTRRSPRASFGLARCCLASGDRAGAIAAYERVPDSSSGYVDAQTARIRCLSDATVAGSDHRRRSAGGRLDPRDLPVDGEQRDRLTAELLETALALRPARRSVR